MASVSGSRRWILPALMCAMMLAAMDITIVATAIPQIVDDLGGFRQFSWVFSIYLLAQTVTIPIYGKLADLFGRKPVLIIGMLIFLAGSAASSVSWNMSALIAFRGLQGLGAGSIMATVTTLAGDLYSVRERAVVQGWLSSVWGVAAIAGPLIGGALAEYLSWRWIFIVNLPIGALALALIGGCLHESFERRHARIDYAGSALMLAAIGSLIFGLLQGGQAWPWASRCSVAVFALAAVLAATTVWVERRAAEPVMPGWLWRRRVLAGANLATIVMGVVMMAPSAYLPTFLQATHGLDAIGAGMVLACMSLGWSSASAVSGRLYMRVGFRATAMLGATLTIAASAAFVLLPQARGTWAVVAGQVVLGAGFGLLFTPLLVGVQAAVGWEQRGVATGASMFSRYLGQSLGAALFGALFNAAAGARLAHAPAALAAGLPRNVDAVVDALHASPIGAATHVYLQETMTLATRHVFAGMAGIAAFAFLFLFVMPRQPEGFQPGA
ncbi:MAG: MFS transporter [Gammaproteobacteria bacterium]|nr:MFS transporter [Gammaproteobacteria bacterium]